MTIELIPGHLYKNIKVLWALRNVTPGYEKAWGHLQENSIFIFIKTNPSFELLYVKPMFDYQMQVLYKQQKLYLNFLNIEDVMGHIEKI